MKALVTGANGFVGSAVCRALCRQEHAVSAMVRDGSDASNLASLPVDIVAADIRDPATLRDAVAGCDAVFHVAADYRLWVPDPQPMYAINVDGTRNVIAACQEAGVERIVYTSSVATLRAFDDGTIAEETTPTLESDMIGHYKRSKFLAERAVDELVDTLGAPVVIVKPSTPIGPGDIRPTPTGRMIRDAIAGRIPAFVDTGLNIVHVDDVAAGHLAALERGRIGRSYILGGEDVSLRAMLEQIAALVGRRPPRFEIPRPVALAYAHLAEATARLTGNEPAATVDGVNMAKKKMYFSSRRARSELGYCFREASEALKSAVDWFQTRG